MADSPNPFLEGEFSQNELPIALPVRQSTPELADITFDTVAAKLIKENLMLTALELHTELVETGREIPKLRDFFSNPGNFERTKQPPDSSPSGLTRSSSIQTFDSIDFAKYSDDGLDKADDRVAVLEFELRKAQDTIKSLRATLTKATENDATTPERLDEQDENNIEETIKPHETRALNFLVNEYLLMHDYKLTSVTFAEENEDQDFDDWDDVGLNISKPPDVLHLYRDFSNHLSPTVEQVDFECNVNLEDELLNSKKREVDYLKERLDSQIAYLEDQISELSKENKSLQQALSEKEQELEEAAALRMITPTVNPMKQSIPQAEVKPTVIGQNYNNIEPELESTNEKPDNKISDLIEKPNNIDSNDTEHVKNESDNADVDNSMNVEVGSVTNPTDADITTDNTTLHDDTKPPDNFTYQHVERKMSQAFSRTLLNMAFHVSQDNRIIQEVSKITDSSSEKVVMMLGRCLPHIVPNVLLAKREELIPLILCTATLHPDGKERDLQLNTLFNLIKRPDQEQRNMILTGCIAFAQHVGPTRVEAELLPQCWEQINHKYSERRLLVAEACGALAPYLPNEIRSSLVLSMLQQMLMDDKSEEVREAVVRSLGLLMGFIDDKDKYNQGSQLLWTGLHDSDEKVSFVAHQVLLPAFAMWADELGKLQSDMLNALLDKIEDLVQGAVSSRSSSSVLPLDETKFNQHISIFEELVPFLFSSILLTGPYIDKIETVRDVTEVEIARFPKPSSQLTDLSTIVGSRATLARYIYLYEAYIAEEWFAPWDGFSWATDDMIPRLLKVLRMLDMSLPRVTHVLALLFNNMCRTFGKTFVHTKVHPIFKEVLTIPEEVMDTDVPNGRTALTTCIVPIYAAGILTSFNSEEERKLLTSFLQELLGTLSLTHSPLDSLKASFAELSLVSEYHEVLLSVLWDGVVHTSALVRSTAATIFELLVKGVSQSLVANRVAPALVTLANDPEISVRIATVPGFGAIVENVTQREMLDKVYMQFQTFMDDPMYHDQHTMLVEIIRTFARIGPNAEPRFRDDFVLPRLAKLAAQNNAVTNQTRKRDVAMQLFEAYSALSCCFISDQLIQVTMIPGLLYLLQDMQQVAPEHEPIISSMIKEFEAKVEASRQATSDSDGGSLHGSGEHGNVGSRMYSKFKDFSIPGKSTVTGMFRKKDKP